MTVECVKGDTDSWGELTSEAVQAVCVSSPLAHTGYSVCISSFAARSFPHQRITAASPLPSNIPNILCPLNPPHSGSNMVHHLFSSVESASAILVTTTVS
jgi:hypothetical protein